MGDRGDVRSVTHVRENEMAVVKILGSDANLKHIVLVPGMKYTNMMFAFVGRERSGNFHSQRWRVMYCSKIIDRL